MNKITLLTILIMMTFFSLGCNKSSKQNEEKTTKDSIVKTIPQVKDIDGNEYKTVKIGTQEWMADNLVVEHYRNGDLIPQVQDKHKWSKITTGAWCYDENDSKSGKSYGKLYNWYAINDSRGLAPKGWHIPNNEEGTKIKGATNNIGFTPFPVVMRINDGRYLNTGKYGYLWSSSEIDFDSALALYCFGSDIGGSISYLKGNGLSIRCVKD
jgi:Fibrobacter succinogenes major domain (Fib_succ_major)